MDSLSDFPDELIEKILLSMCLVDAARTCVLSRMWQYAWTRLPNLVLDQNFLSGAKIENKFDYLHKVNSLLVQHTGPLEEFYVDIVDFEDADIVDLEDAENDYANQSIYSVLMRGVKKLTIHNWGKSPYVWPSSFPNSPSLTYLELNHCAFKQEPSFRGFQNLTCLAFYDVACDYGILSSIISNSPNLQRIVLKDLSNEDEVLTICAPRLKYLILKGKLKSFHLENPQSLKEMDILLFYMTEYSTWTLAYLIDFFGSLVKLESLKLGHETFMLFENAGYLKMLPSGLRELRFLQLTGVFFKDVPMLRCYLCLIRSSINLRRLEIVVLPVTDFGGEELNLQVQRNENCTLQHLEKVYIGPILGTKNEMELIEFLLWCSPTLQSMTIWHSRGRKSAARKKCVRALAQLPHASPNVKISFSNEYWGA